MATANPYSITLTGGGLCFVSKGLTLPVSHIVAVQLPCIYLDPRGAARFRWLL